MHYSFLHGIRLKSFTNFVNLNGKQKFTIGSMVRFQLIAGAALNRKEDIKVVI
jgi:hypothetical protein